ncbi:hypothetical protein K456DRAFT_46309 [Colletotrichum gloeosporioides 23]|nr:hypothetical protein K456DRAFT_46309 [Colletotrichum gloeosporioides 23]
MVGGVVLRWDGMGWSLLVFVLPYLPNVVSVLDEPMPRRWGLDLYYRVSVDEIPSRRRHGGVGGCLVSQTFQHFVL